MRLLTVIALLVAFGLPTAGAAQAGTQPSREHPPGGIGVRLADTPADARDPLSRSYIVERLKPGTNVRRRIEIINTTTSVATVAVYAAAARLQGGAFTFASGRTKNELARWTSIAEGTVRLEPGTSFFDTVTVNVPADASGGERYAVVWAAISAPASSGGQGVSFVNRVGVRMYLSIGSGTAGTGSFAMSGLAARRAANGQPLVLATIANTGKWTLDLAGTLTLSSGPAGLRAAQIPIVVRPPLPPGVATQIQVPLDDSLPRGPWRARIRLQSGDLTHTLAATVTFPGRPVSATVRSESLPWLFWSSALAGVLALVGLAIAATFWLTRRTARNAR